MPNPIKVLTGAPPNPVTNPNTPATPTVQSYIDQEFIRKTEFSDNSNTTTCYVLDGGDSTSQPCDDQ